MLSGARRDGSKDGQKCNFLKQGQKNKNIEKKKENKKKGWFTVTKDKN